MARRWSGGVAMTRAPTGGGLPPAVKSNPNPDVCCPWETLFPHAGGYIVAPGHVFDAYASPGLGGNAMKHFMMTVAVAATAVATTSVAATSALAADMPT